jgi:hypothetical protein
VREALPQVGSVLVKGSRFMKMEQVVEAMVATAEQQQPAPGHGAGGAHAADAGQWLQGLSPEFGFLRVFQYLTFRAVMAAMTALLIGLVAGPGDPPC